MADLKVKLCGLELDNPIIPASGCFGYGKEFAEYYDINILGSFSFKGTTRYPKDGNEQPRIAECPCGMLNSVGLQNPGVHKVIEHELPEMKKYFTKKVIANISGDKIEDYVYVASLLDKEEQVGIIEVNISCPNIHGGGMAFGTDPDVAASVTRAVKQVTTKPVFVKLTPNVTDITIIARACEDAGADGLSLINTVQGMRINIKTGKPVLGRVMGGMSGPALFPLALRMVYQVTSAVSIPVMGMGGVSCARDVVEMMMAGASAVQVGAANLTDPYACKKIIEELETLVPSLGYEKISDMIGVSKK